MVVSAVARTTTREAIAVDIFGALIVVAEQAGPGQAGPYEGAVAE